jgi:predicted phage terminase large subunit-like protein
MSRKSQAARVVYQRGQDQPPVRLPSLHPLQNEIKEDDARFKVVVCGRQFGKTTLGVVMCLEEALLGGDVWWVAPTFPLADEGWRDIEKLIAQIPGSRTEGRPIWRATLPGGGTIQVKSADNPDSLRGATLDGLVLDEAAIAKHETWPTLRPTLTIREGWAMFISTPHGTNWFYDLYEGVPKQEGWKRWTFPSVGSPFVSPEEVEKARRGGMSSLLFAQEFLAEFISYASGVFRADWFKHYRLDPTSEEPIYMLGDEAVLLSDCEVFHTVDLAFSKAEDADYTVVLSWAQTPKQHLILLDMQRDRYEGFDILPVLRRTYDRWGGVIVVERVQRGIQIIEEANRTGLVLKEVRAEKDKKIRAQLASARMESGRLWFPPASTPWFSEVEDEMLAFPEGKHDDIVDCVSYAVAHAAKRSVYESRGIVSV